MSAIAFHAAFEATARRLPDKLALVCGSQRVAYRELLARVQALAATLRADGVSPGDRVVALLENGVEFAVAVHAVSMVGGVFVPVSPLAKADKLRFIVEDCGATVLLTHDQLAPAWTPVLREVPALRRAWVAGVAGSAPVDPRVRPWAELQDVAIAPVVDRPDLALLIYTSGTTGHPKGVMLAHSNLASVWRSIQAWLQLREDDVIGLVLPTAFSYGLNNLLMALATGATVVLERWAAFPVRLVELLARERVTMLPGVPTLFSSVLGLRHLSTFDLGSLRTITNAGAALPEAHVRRLRAAFPRARLFLMYGMTECVRASYLPPDEVDTRPTSVGRGMPHQAHWLVDETGRRLPHGSTGELIVCGRHVMLGYWGRESDTATRLKPGVSEGEREYRTGDIFRSDADGYLYFVSRTDDIIKTRGEKVAPREVENAIYRLDGVTGCAVVGVPDEALGQAVKAYVTLKPGSKLTGRDIVRHCLACLESYMAPRSVEIVEALPRTESGKIRHASLREAAPREGAS